MKSKIYSMLICIACCFGIVALPSCGDDNDDSTPAIIPAEEEQQQEELPEGVASLSSHAATLLVKAEYSGQAYFYVFDGKSDLPIFKILALLITTDTNENTFTARVSELESGKTYTFKLVSSANLDLTKLLTFITKSEESVIGKSVDLGLSVKWASCNVGASSPEDCGGYYAWGEVAEKNEYLPTTSATYQQDIKDFSGDPKYDVAAKLWGKGWRMPTFDEFEELRDNCKWEWTTLNDILGYKVTGKTGNSIFIPAAGYHYSVTLKHWQTHGVYWSSTPKEGSSTNTASYFTFDHMSFGMFGLNRYDGMSIRPVKN